jgi:uncharacterized damage-inducible protein DinB
MDLRHPIGRFTYNGPMSGEQRLLCIEHIEVAPSLLREAVDGLSPEQLDTPYREGGWTVRQVVHHLPDSHLNSYTRMKLALTETVPTIKPYYEDRWAELADSRTADIELSLLLLDALHKRWVFLLRSLTTENFTLKFNHPEQGIVTLDRTLALYAWHGRHHVAHITSLRERMVW